MNEARRCVRRHRACSPFHAALVESYREARDAAYVASETLDVQDERCAVVPRFRDWLVGAGRESGL